MSGEGWLAMKDSSTHQSWISRPGIYFLSDLYFVHVFTFHVLLLIWVWWGTGAARFGATTATFETFLLFGGLCSLQASVYKFLLEGRPLWSPFLTLFNTIFNLQTFFAVTGWVASGSFRVLVLWAPLRF